MTIVISFALKKFLSGDPSGGELLPYYIISPLINRVDLLSAE